MESIESIRSAEDGVSADTTDEPKIAALNLVAVSRGDLSSAQEILGRLPGESRWDIGSRRTALRDELDQTDEVVEAINARLLALRKWEDIHDPDRLLDQHHLMEAASAARLFETEHGLGFNDTSFGELIEFVADLPW